MEYLIYVSLILITLICLWALVSIPKNYLFKSLLIPAMLMVAVSMWYTYQAVLGFGTEFKPDKKVMYHSHIADKKNDKIYKILEISTKWFEDNLNKSKLCKDYLNKRNLSDETIQYFKLGFSSNSKQTLYQFLKEKLET